MAEKRHVRPTCFVLLSVQGKQLCPCKLNLYMLYLLCFVMFVHISCFFLSLCSPYLKEIKKSSSSSLKLGVMREHNKTPLAVKDKIKS